MSDFEIKILQRVRFWKKTYLSKSELKKFQRLRFWRKICIQKITFWLTLLRINDNSCNFCAFLECIILNSKCYNVSAFQLKTFQRVRLWIKYFTTCHFKLKIFNPSDFESTFWTRVDFELNILQRVPFWVYFFCSLPSFHAFIKMGHISVMFKCMVCVRLVTFLC